MLACVGARSPLLHDAIHTSDVLTMPQNRHMRSASGLGRVPSKFWHHASAFDLNLSASSTRSLTLWPLPAEEEAAGVCGDEDGEAELAPFKLRLWSTGVETEFALVALRLRRTGEEAAASALGRGR